MSTSPAATHASFKAAVDALYQPVSTVAPEPGVASAARYDGFADAVAATQVPADEVAQRGAIVSAARAVAAAVRADDSSAAAMGRTARAVVALRELVRGLPQ